MECGCPKGSVFWQSGASYWTRCWLLGIVGRVWENVLQDTDGPGISPRLPSVRKTLYRLVISFAGVILPLQFGHISQWHLSGRILARELDEVVLGGKFLKFLLPTIAILYT